MSRSWQCLQVCQAGSTRAQHAEVLKHFQSQWQAQQLELAVQLPSVSNARFEPSKHDCCACTETLARRAPPANVWIKTVKHNSMRHLQICCIMEQICKLTQAMHMCVTRFCSVQNLHSMVVGASRNCLAFVCNCPISTTCSGFHAKTVVYLVCTAYMVWLL